MSAPAMKRAVKVSAPGKVILFGEHSVVHGRRCIATAINLRTTVTLEHRADRGGELNVNLLGSHAVLCWIDGELQVKHCDTNLSAVNTALAAIREVLMITRVPPTSGMDLHIQSDVPLGRGLGSSASFAVALSGALLLYNETITDTQDAAALNNINELALAVESCIHGRPSGVDNTISCYGGMLLKHGNRLQPMSVGAPLLMFVVDTNVERSTRQLVETVRQRLEVLPEVMERLLDAADAIAARGQEVLKAPEVDMRELITLMEMNQGVLDAFGVGHSAVRRTPHFYPADHKVSDVVAVSRGLGFCGVKVTGAGGGGCMVVLQSGKSDRLQEKLTERGYRCMAVQTGEEGVRIELNVTIESNS